ncbi:uncharacterized protein LOC133310245 [Gastrolobium bilobum]|uniref:uncharacterized protein LOC133310245 n=1 Tax=Gastrolobium bilobum TaxID=150636 RepID=UPI002AB2CA41|nr:uncharacterized protein LOC133310245 [Gastrolobium bilobum]
MRFSSLDDLNLAITGRPWIILGHYLAARKWEPCFDPDKANIHKVAAWVRLPGIPQEYCEFALLNQLGTIIGKVLKVDRTTSTGDRARFARVCIEVDLSQPLRGEYILDGCRKKVEYEGLFLICLKCGRYGHNSESCPDFIRPIPTEKEVPIPEQSIGDQCPQGVGPWMVVQRRRRVHQQFQKKEIGGGRKFGEDISNKNLSKEGETNVGPSKTASVKTRVTKENEGERRTNSSNSSGMNFTAAAVNLPRKNTGHKTPGPLGKKQAVKKPNSKGKEVFQHTSADGATSSILTEQKSTRVEDQISVGNYKGERWGDLMMAAEASMEEGIPAQSVGNLAADLMSNVNGVEEPDPPDNICLQKFKQSEGQTGMEIDPSLGASLINPMNFDCNTACNTEIDVDRESGSVIQSLSSKGAAKKQFKSTFTRFCKKHNVGVTAIFEPRDVGITIISHHEQFVHCWVEFPASKGLFWTAIYASPQVNNRQVLWEELKHIGRNMNESWLLTGDFNEIALASEKRGGGPVDVNRCNLFASVLNACGVMDLGGGGNRFTWRGPKFLNLDRVYKRLDRAVGNEGWRADFEEVDVLVLPRLFSDHNPVLVRLRKVDSCWRERPFRYLAAWQNDVRFTSFVKANWKADAGLLDNLTSLVPLLKDWNKNIFGFIQARKNKLIARMEGIQRQLSYCNNYKLEKLESNLKKELNSVLDQEEQLWKNNKILKLQDDRGFWVSEEEELIVFAREFFLNLFMDNSEEPLWFHTNSSWPNMREDQLSSLDVDLSFEEVKRAFFQMPPLKAPGADGYPAMFYQKNWEMLKSQIFNSMQYYLKNPSQIGEINHTLIVLIPKIDRPCMMKQFRPIALCNSIYKGFSKILANRVKPLLEELISPNQASFVPRRHIHDNIIIVQELIHSMHRMKGKKGFFSIKIDLEKAYDKLSWKFIRSVLEDLQFPIILVEAIMGCVPSPSLEVLWNGVRTDSFLPQRGIRQGDPLSPYIFVLCLEKLTHLILDEVGSGAWVPLKAGRSGPPISHIMFADDIILFGEASLSQLNCITSCLDRFSKMSGQCVSFEKSCIYFSKNVKREEVQAISDVSGFKIVKNFGRYLGSKMRHGRIGKDHYVENNMMPVHVCNDIEKLQRNFIWGDEELKRKAHYVAWEVMCQPKECGGLGIINLRLQNEAFMHKLAWQIIEDQNSLWVQVLLGKYGRKADPNRSLTAKKSDSTLWRNICSARNKISQHLEWVIRNGKTAFFWTDQWGGWQRTMLDMAATKPPMADLNLKISDVVNPFPGEWNWSYLDKHLDVSVCNELRKIPTPKPSNSEDGLCWKNLRSGRSVVRNAYCFLLKSNLEKDKIWDSMWKWKGPYRIAVFLWLACLDKLPVRSITCLWSGGEAVCPTCLRENENLMHALRDCKNARSIWEAWFDGKVPANFLNINGLDWFIINLHKPFFSRFWKSWKEVFFVTCWFLWKWSNATIHEEFFSRPQDPLCRILNFLKDTKRSSSLEPFTVDQNLVGFSGIPLQALTHEGVKIFVDGAVNLSTSFGACGGVACSAQGDWLSGFSFNIGPCSSLEAELLGIFHGLNLAMQLKLADVWVGCDSKEAIACLEAESEAFRFFGLIDKIRKLALSFDHFLLEYTPRDVNTVADSLAKIGLDYKGEELNLFPFPPLQK